MQRIWAFGFGLFLFSACVAAGQAPAATIGIISIAPAAESALDSNAVVTANLSYEITGFDPGRFIYTISTFAQNTLGGTSRVDATNTVVLKEATGQILVRNDVSAFWHRSTIARPFELSYYLFRTPLQEQAEPTAMQTISPIAHVGPVHFPSDH